MTLRSSRAHPAVVFETIPAPGAWIQQAACADEPTDLFFPEDQPGIELAKAICGACPVKPECASYAIAIPSLDGIWGGLTRHERTKLRVGHDCRTPRSKGTCTAGGGSPARARGCRT